MKTTRNITIICLLAAFSAFAQTSLVQTTLSVAQARSDSFITLTSATGVSAPGIGTAGTQLYVADYGQNVGETETILLADPNNALRFQVQRTSSKTVAHAVGAMILLGPPNYFQKYDPTGICTGSYVPSVTPWLNTNNGLQWLCSSITGTWVPGFGNFSAPAQPTTAWASGTAAMVPTGPLFHVSGNSAMTSITVPVGGSNGAPFCVIWDSTGSTSAGNNILRASQGAAGLTTCFTYSPADAKYYASN